MRLIDAPIGIFRFDGELVLKTEYYSENKQSGKYTPDCYIIRTGEYFWGGAKTANEFINLDVEPVDFAELLPTVTDTISRQAAIEAADKIIERDTSGNNAVVNAMIAWSEYIRQLPPAEPKRGKWEITNLGAVGVFDSCSECKRVVKHKAPFYNFCPNCGAKMEVK